MAEDVSGEPAVSRRKRKTNSLLKGIVIGTVATAILGTGVAGVYVAQEQEVSMREYVHGSETNSEVAFGLRTVPAYQSFVENDVFKTQAWKEYAASMNAANDELNQARIDEDQKLKSSILFPDLRKRLDALGSVSYDPNEKLGLNSAYDEYSLFADISNACEEGDIAVDPDSGELLVERKDASEELLSIVSKPYGDSIPSEEMKKHSETLASVFEEARKGYCSK